MKDSYNNCFRPHYTASPFKSECKDISFFGSPKNIAIFFNPYVLYNPHNRIPSIFQECYHFASIQLKDVRCH